MVSRKIEPGQPQPDVTPEVALPPLPASERMATLRETLGRTSDPADYARVLLEALGRADHPDAAGNPIYALYQVAVDYRCSAEGYRTLYLRRPALVPGRPSA